MNAYSARTNQLPAFALAQTAGFPEVYPHLNRHIFNPDWEVKDEPMNNVPHYPGDAARLQQGLPSRIPLDNAGSVPFETRHFLHPQSQIAGSACFDHQHDVTSKPQTAFRPSGPLRLSIDDESAYLPVEFIQNGKQQDAYRCIPPGRNPGCGIARQPN
ncbi:MAG: hypothetical protein L3J32_09125 [Rhizobiaceae bacterium]|nr:hypothetical protein [Rhizobiaceae bacterium]